MESTSAPLAALDRILVSSRLTHTGPEAAEEAGVDPTWAGELWRAAGFDGRFEDRELSKDDVGLLAVAAGLVESGRFDNTDVLQFARMFNLAAAPLAESAADALARSLSAAGTTARLAELDSSVAQFEKVLLHTWRRRLVRVLSSGRATERMEEGVAFVDLVGFTDLVRRGDAWLPMLDRLEAVVFDEVASRGGHVIKTIGDEVMWVSPDREDTVGTCTAVAAAIAADSFLPAVRIGAAWGETVATRGDRFGTPVNLASRLVRRCRPGEVLLCPALADVLPGRRSSRPRWIKGMGWVRVARVRPESVAVARVPPGAR